MIDTQVEASKSVRRFWSGHVRQRIEALNLDDRTSACDISESVAVFCEQHSYVPDHALSLLLARSFCTLGDADAAERVLLEEGQYRGHTGVWIETLSSEYPFPELYPLFSARVVYPLYFNTVGDSSTWVLNLNNIQLTTADHHELIIFQLLRVLGEKISNVWQKTDGDGALAVRGLSCLDVFLNMYSTQDLLDYLTDILTHHAQINGWSAHPTVLLLDF